MLDGILNNRKEWNAKKEEYEAKLKAIEEQKAAKAPATAGKFIAQLWMNLSTFHIKHETKFKSHLKPSLFFFLVLAPANNPSSSGSKTCSVS